MDTVTKITILGVPFHKVTREKTLGLIEQMIEEGAQHFVVTPNPEMVVESQENKEFLGILRSADLSIADGTGILWAAGYGNGDGNILRWCGAVASLLYGFLFPRYLKRVLPERVTGTDVFQDVCRKGAEKGWKIYLLGAAPGVAEEAKKVLEKRYAGLNIVGIYAGSPRSEDEDAVISRVNECRPDILFVAYGAPAQEMWIHRNMKKMPSVKVYMGIGGAFDFVAGKQKRAPEWMRTLGLEWLYRLKNEPKRFRRIYNATIRFIGLVIR